MTLHCIELNSPKAWWSGSMFGTSYSLYVRYVKGTSWKTDTNSLISHRGTMHWSWWSVALWYHEWWNNHHHGMGMTLANFICFFVFFCSRAWLLSWSGPFFNIKAILPGIDRDPDCKDKTVVKLSYLYNGNSHTCKTPSLHETCPQYKVQTYITQSIFSKMLWIDIRYHTCESDVSVFVSSKSDVYIVPLSLLDAVWTAVIYWQCDTILCEIVIYIIDYDTYHWGRVMHICVSKLTIIDSDNHLNQCWNIVNCTLRNKLQWNFNWNSNMFIQENALENVVCEMASILSWPQCLEVFGQTCHHNIPCPWTCIS